MPVDNSLATDAEVVRLIADDGTENLLMAFWCCVIQMSKGKSEEKTTQMGSKNYSYVCHADEGSVSAYCTMRRINARHPILRA